MASIEELLSDPASRRRVERRSRAVDHHGSRPSRCGASLPVKGRFAEFSGDGQITDTQTVFGRIDIKVASVRHRDPQTRRAPALRRFLRGGEVPRHQRGGHRRRRHRRRHPSICAHELTIKDTTEPMPLQDEGAPCSTTARCALTAEGHHRPQGLRRRRQLDGDDRATTRRFRRRRVPAPDSIVDRRMTDAVEPLRILVYSDNPRTREQVQLALGKRVASRICRN